MIFPLVENIKKGIKKGVEIFVPTAKPKKNVPFSFQEASKPAPRINQDAQQIYNNNYGTSFQVEEVKPKTIQWQAYQEESRKKFPGLYTPTGEPKYESMLSPAEKQKFQVQTPVTPTISMIKPEEQAYQEKQSAERQAKAKKEWVQKELGSPVFGLGGEGTYNRLSKENPTYIKKLEEQYDSERNIASSIAEFSKTFDQDIVQMLGGIGKVSEREVKSAMMEAINPKTMITAATVGIINGEDLSSIGQDVYTKDGRIYYKGFEVADEYLTEPGKKMKVGADIVAGFIGGIGTYGGISSAIGKGVSKLAAAQLPGFFQGITKVAQGVEKAKKIAPLLTEMTAFNALEETAELGIRKLTGQEYTFNDFMQGLAIGGAMGATINLAGRSLSNSSIMKFLQKVEKTLDTRLDTRPNIESLRTISLQGRTVGDWFDSARMAYYKKPDEGSMFGKPDIHAGGRGIPKAEMEVLPKEVSTYEESKAVGAKRIAPDRVPHQQLTPEEGMISLIEKAKQKAAKNSESWVNAASDLDKMISNYGDKLPTRTEANMQKYPDLSKDYSKYSDLKKYATFQTDTLSGLKDQFLQKSEIVNWSPKKEEAYRAKVAEEYKALVKADISKGYRYPEAVLNYDKSFLTAVNGRERYEKGLRTSFSVDDERIVFEDTDTIGAGMKRQDGKPITTEQKNEIKQGVTDFADVLGLNMKKLAENNRWVYVHLNDKNPFLMKETAGLYRQGKENISISVGGREAFVKLVDGKKVKEYINPTVAHELGHALDAKSGQKLFNYSFIYNRTKDFNSLNGLLLGRHGVEYYRRPKEVTARMIEQYVSVQKGSDAFYDREGYWTKEIFDKEIKPTVEAAMDKHFSEYRTEGKAEDIVPEKTDSQTWASRLEFDTNGNRARDFHTLVEGHNDVIKNGVESKYYKSALDNGDAELVSAFDKLAPPKITPLENPLPDAPRSASEELLTKQPSEKSPSEMMLNEAALKNGKTQEEIDSMLVSLKNITGKDQALYERQIKTITERQRSAASRAAPIAEQAAQRAEINSLKLERAELEAEVKEKAMNDVFAEMQIAEAGRRIFDRSGVHLVVSEQKSTFPKWVPDELRSRDLFDKVIKLISEGKPSRKGAVNIEKLRKIVEDKIAETATKDELGEFLKDMDKYIEGVQAKMKDTATSLPTDSKVSAQDEVNKSLVESKATPSQKALLEQPTKGTQPTQEAPSSQSKLDNQKVSSDESIKQDDKVVKAVEKTAKEVGDSVPKVNRVVRAVKELTTRFIENVQDAEVRVRKLIERPDLKVTDMSNPYQKATLYPGKVAAKVEKGYEIAEGLIKDMQSLGKTSKIELETIRKDVNDYLIAQHAPERNAALGDGAAGITTEAAKARIAEIESSPQGAKIKEIAERAIKLNEQTLDMLRDSRVISDELYTTLRTKYKNHVPLQRIFEESDDVGTIMAGKGFDVKSTGIQRAKGSKREVDDILTNIITNYEQAVLRSEKNIVDQATLAFVRDNESSLDGLMNIRKPKAIGQDFEGKVLKEKTNDPTILQLFEDGKPVWIKIEDPNLAVALRGVGREKLPTILRGIGAFTRFYSGLATRFNPEFALPNKLRDLQETAIFLASQKEFGMKGAAKTVARDLFQQNTKAVIDALRGKDTEGARLYNEMRELGGTTGGMGLSTKDQVKLNIADIEKLATSKTRKLASNLVKYVDNWNTIFEDSTRLSVYRQALAQGATKDRAAFLAKEASINFNRMGKGGPVINAMWMFSNASIQGSAKMIKSLKNPKVLAAVTVAVGTAVAAVAEWNDKVDPDWRDKVPKWDRLNGLPVMIPSTDGGIQYIVIPVSWGVKPIKVMADYIYDSVSGEDINLKDAMGDVGVAILEAYNPIGGTDLVSALTPTILDIPVEIARNKSWSGNKIKPDFDPNAPEDIRYFDSLEKTKTGQVAISISEFLQEKGVAAISPADIKYAFDGIVGGAGRAVGKTFNVIGGLASGESIPLDEYPFVSRFYRKSTKEEVETNAAGKDTGDIKDILQGQSRARFELREEAEALLEGLKGKPAEEIVAKLTEVAKNKPELAEKFKEIAEDMALGLDRTDKLVKQLGVDNGKRAQYIYDEIEKITDPKARGEYIVDLAKKKILTEAVGKQLVKLKQGGAAELKAQAKDAKSEKSMADIAGLYVKAFGVDPLTAVQTLFTSEQLKDVRGDAVIMERMGVQASEAVKRKGGAGPTDKLDHRKSLELGGDNSEDNLRIVTEAEWKSYTPVENYLGERLNKGTIEEDDAGKAIVDFKDGKITFDEIKAKYP